MLKYFFIGAGACVLFLQATKAGRDMGNKLEFLAVKSGQGLGVSNSTTQQQDNVSAFLKTIRAAEGTAGALGYQTLFGGSLFYSFEDHPRKIITVKTSAGKVYKSSAAGAYQFLKATWDDVARQIGANDFSPENQDKAAVFLINQRGALEDVKAGRFKVAVEKVRSIWASFPNAGYGQPEKKLSELAATYTSAGGVIV